MTYPGDGKDDLEHDDEIVEDTYDAEDEVFETEEQLALADDEEDLPWLEADEYEDDDGFDWGILRFGLLALLALVVLLGAIWWLTRERPDPELVADGSTVEAPDGPYKQRPDDPGGAEVEGTGDQAFAVAEGDATRGRIADGGESGAASDGAATGPSIDRNQSAAASGAASGAASATADSAGAAYVQIGAFSSRADADAAWRSATSRYSALSGLNHRVVEGDVNGATVYRLQAIAANRAAGEEACRAIRSAGGDCYLR